MSTIMVERHLPTVVTVVVAVAVVDASDTNHWTAWVVTEFHVGSLNFLVLFYLPSNTALFLFNCSFENLFLLLSQWKFTFLPPYGFFICFSGLAPESTLIYNMISKSKCFPKVLPRRLSRGIHSVGKLDTPCTECSNLREPRSFQVCLRTKSAWKCRVRSPWEGSI